MPATAQNHTVTQRLNGLATVRLVRQHAPREAGTIALPAQPRIDPRRDALAAKIAAQISASGEPAVKSPPPARSLFNTLFDVPTLAVSFVATGLLVGSAFATMMLMDTIDAPWPESSPAEERTVAPVLSASAADAPLPVVAQPSAPPVHSVRTVALPPADQSAPEAVTAAAPEAADGHGLFGDVREVYRDDGQSGVPFGAVYGTQGPSPALTESPDQPVPAPAEEPEEAVQAGEDPDANWIELPRAVNLRAAPSTRSKVIGVIEQGTKLQELERQRGWVKVIDPETSETGWLYPNSVPKARRAVKPTEPPESETKPAQAGPFATLENWLSKPAQQQQ